VTKGVGVARQHDVRWGRSLCDGNASIADFFCMLYIFLIFSVHCHSGDFKIGLSGTIGDNVYAVFFRYFVLNFC